MIPRYYQTEALDAIFAYWADEAGNPLVDMATGTGKSGTMAMLTVQLAEGWPDLRIMNIAHREELVEGNYAELVDQWPLAPVGVYAAALNRRDARAQILFAQIQTVWNKAQEIGHVDVLEIDEVHLVPAEAETMYGKLIGALLEINPDMKIVGFTATPYRLDSGRLDEGDNRMFDKVVYTYSISQGVEDGYLSPLSSKAMGTSFDLTGVGTAMGDYKKGALAAAVDKEEVTRLAVAEAVKYSQTKRTVLWFCSGVDHAMHVRDEIRRHGETCEMITGTTAKGERRRIIADFKSGVVKNVTNDAVLTVGTNIPGIDMIADLAPTKSTSRFVQKAGRGTRPIYRAGFDANDPKTTAEERRAAIASGPKPSCLYLDYAKNVSYHGPVDMAQPRKPGEGKGEPPVKQCPTDVEDIEGKFGCDELIPISLMTCSCCGYIFPPSMEEKLTRVANDAPIMSTEKPWYQVDGREFAPHPAKVAGNPPSVKVTYKVGKKKRSEWICCQHMEHPVEKSRRFPKQKADRYWTLHGGQLPFPKTVDEFLDRAGELKATTEVQLDFSKNPTYPEIMAHRAGDAEYGTEVSRPEESAGNLGGLLGLRRPVALPAKLYEDLEDEIPF